MDLLLNDLSIHGQFHDAATFREAIHRISSIRVLAQKFDRDLHCHRNTVNRFINPSASVFHAIQTFTRDQKMSLLSWMTKQGPFWEDAREHNPDHWLECGGEIVTDTAVGEAAYCMTMGINRQLVSFSPSDWEYSPIPVVLSANGKDTIEALNWWEQAGLATALERAEPPIATWSQLKVASASRYPRLRFSADSFEPLDGHPFVPGAARGVERLLHTLDRLMGCVDESGRRTPEGTRILQEHFTGGNAWFTDSSDTEKSRFEDQLTFSHPDIPGHSLFCTWHGKVKTEVIRLHFSWPVTAGESLYIVYVGPKITKT